MSHRKATSSYPQQAILDAFHEARSRMPEFSIGALAKQMQLSHGHIQAARIGNGVTSLALTPCDMVMRLPSLGAVEITTTSPHAHLQSKSDALRIAGNSSGSISLRMLLPHWHWACLSKDETPKIEIFDRYGRLLHSISSRLDVERGQGWQRLERLSYEKLPAFTELMDISQEFSYPSAKDSNRFVESWRSISSESEASELLKKHHLRRIDAYQALENRFTQRMSNRCFISTLERAARAHSPIRVSVANAGAVHQQSGIFGHIGERHHNINIVGENARLQIEREAIAQTWLVTQPCKDGVKTRLEAFSKNGRLISSLSETIDQPLPVSTMQAMSVYG